MIYKYTAISFMMIIVVGIATWTTFMSYRPQNNTSTNTKQLPDAFMEDITAFIMDKQGKLSMKIVTPKMIHFTENDTTMLTTPQLTLYRKSPNPWFVTAKYAKATEGVENVHFWDNVMIQHDADQVNPATLIKTSTLMVHPNRKTAETNQFVTMIQPNLVVKAIGMQADMNSGDIKLLSQTRGEYVPSLEN
jgi:lipopolysaccharide export system protein LptC